MAADERIADVVVLGSGGAGLTAAVVAHDHGAETVLIEKAAQLGGTTGVSGGMPWVPGHRHLAKAGVTDSREEALQYVRRLTQGREPDPHLLEVYVDRAAEMVAYLEDHTPVRFFPTTGFSDYYADLPGGKPCGRSIEPEPFDAVAQLGAWADRVRSSPVMPPITMEEGGVAQAQGSMPDADLIARRTASGVRTMGGALAAALTFDVFDPVAQEYPNEAPVWMLFDQRLRDGAVISTLIPGEPTPDWVDHAPTLRGLAERIGVDPDGLEATVAAFNDHARQGEDPDFARGTTWWEGFLTGGPTVDACLAPIDQPPYYALPIYRGVLGTNGGLRIDEHGRVLRMRGGTIGGLYAAGNAAASIFGPAYPGGGATLGPALTFGFLAGRHVATAPVR